MTVQKEFQSTHPGWGATYSPDELHGYRPISIHAPRVGCDADDGSISADYANFNPRTPGGVRLLLTACPRTKAVFQSTHPGWGATTVKAPRCKVERISIHAPRVGCDSIYTSPPLMPKYFNPRTPGGVRRCGASIDVLYGYYFNPRTPGGVRRIYNVLFENSWLISIHAPRVGCDGMQFPIIVPKWYISIHAPRVGCDISLCSSSCIATIFQSTHPGWGATAIRSFWH